MIYTIGPNSANEGEVYDTSKWLKVELDDLGAYNWPVRKSGLNGSPARRLIFAAAGNRTRNWQAVDEVRL
jgi:hypothetical protein